MGILQVSLVDGPAQDQLWYLQVPPVNHQRCQLWSRLVSPHVSHRVGHQLSQLVNLLLLLVNRLLSHQCSHPISHLLSRRRYRRVQVVNHQVYQLTSLLVPLQVSCAFVEIGCWALPWGLCLLLLCHLALGFHMRCPEFNVVGDNVARSNQTVACDIWACPGTASVSVSNVAISLC